MRVTSKGTVTIPQALREKAGIYPGAEVDFVYKNGSLVLKKRRGESHVDEIIRNMVGKGNLKMTTDEIMALTRGDR